MITPSRYFAGGKGLDSFRKSMLSDHHITKMVDYINAKDCFPENSISGGVNYFLWERDVTGTCEFSTVSGKGVHTMQRTLDEFSTFIRYNQAISIIHKLEANGMLPLSAIVSSRNPYGLPTSVRGAEKRTHKDDIAVYSSKGIGYLNLSKVGNCQEAIDNFRIMISRITYEHAGEPDKDGMLRVLSKIQVLSPMELCTDSYLIIGGFKGYEEANNLATYLKTKFARFLVSQTLSAINLSKEKFSFVPIQDFSKFWTDEELYAKYGLTDEEIAFIESMIRPMDLGGGKNG